MDISDYREDILSTPLVASLPAEMQERVVDVCLQQSTPQQAGVGDLIYSQGTEDEDTGCMLVEGRVEVAIEGEEPIHLQAPTLLGEMKHFTEATERTATVRVLRDATVLTFYWHDFMKAAAEILSQDEQRILTAAIRELANVRLTSADEL